MATRRRPARQAEAVPAEAPKALCDLVFDARVATAKAATRLASTCTGPLRSHRDLVVAADEVLEAAGRLRGLASKATWSSTPPGGRGQKPTRPRRRRSTRGTP